ncbi:hypothetical protein ACLKA6_002505 [Drosophila palustris]
MYENEQNEEGGSQIPQDSNQPQRSPSIQDSDEDSKSEEPPQTLPCQPVLPPQTLPYQSALPPQTLPYQSALPPQTLPD